VDRPTGIGPEVGRADLGMVARIRRLGRGRSLTGTAITISCGAIGDRPVRGGGTMAG